MHEDIYPPPAHACNVSCAHRTISVDSEAATHHAMREALEVLRAALHPSMAHRSGAHRLWPSAPPRGAGVAGGDLSTVSGLHPRQTRAVAASAAREPQGHSRQSGGDPVTRIAALLTARTVILLVRGQMRRGE